MVAPTSCLSIVYPCTSDPPPQASDPASDATLKPLDPPPPEVAALRLKVAAVLDRGLAPADDLAAALGEFAGRLSQVRLLWFGAGEMMVSCHTPEGSHLAIYHLSAKQSPEALVAAWEAEGHSLEETGAELERLLQVARLSKLDS